MIWYEMNTIHFRTYSQPNTISFSPSHVSSTQHTSLQCKLSHLTKTILKFYFYHKNEWNEKIKKTTWYLNKLLVTDNITITRLIWTFFIIQFLLFYFLYLNNNKKECERGKARRWIHQIYQQEESNDYEIQFK